MNETLDTLLEKMRVLEKDILRELQKKELEFFYEVRQGKIRFTEEARARHKLLIKRFTSYIRDSRFWIVVTKSLESSKSWVMAWRNFRSASAWASPGLAGPAV